MIEATQSRDEWTRVGVEALGAGIFRIPLPLPSDALKAVNVYAVVTGNDVTLIDAGWALESSRDVLASGLATLGLGLADITRFLVTHIHRDHYTQAITVRREFGTSVALGNAERLSFAGFDDLDQVNDGGRRLLVRCGIGACIDEYAAAASHGPVEALIDYEPPDRWLTSYECVSAGRRHILVIPTPGHTRGHVAYQDATAGMLFAGDHVLPQITPSIGFEVARQRWPLYRYLNSLKLIRQLPDARLLPAHGPVGPSVHRRIDELLLHHERRLADSKHLVEAGRHTAFDVAQGLTWTRHERHFDELDQFSRALAVLESYAHLQVLELGLEIEVVQVDGVDWYKAA